MPSPEMESQRGAAPAEWAFVPGDDLLLLLGEGGGFFFGFFGWRNMEISPEKKGDFTIFNHQKW